MSNFWSGKKVVLLGGASLIGAHLAKALVNLPIASLRVVDDLSSGSLSNLHYLGVETRELGDVDFYAVDLRDYNNAFRAVKRSDVVFHLASQHGGRGYVAGHRAELLDNLGLDMTIFRACSDASVGKVIFSSSACAYPVKVQCDPNEILYLKEELIDYNKIFEDGPSDGLYGTEKLLGEVQLDNYIDREEFKGVSTRSFTVYGPLMKENHAIGAMIAKTAIRQKPFEIWGDSENPAIRNWTFVEDNVAGALLAAEHIDRGAINIGVEDRVTPFRAARTIWEIMGWHPNEVQYRPDKPVGPLNRVADASKLKALGWKPRYTFEEGLRKTIEWYLSTHKVEDIKKDFEKRLTER